MKEGWAHARWFLALALALLAAACDQTADEPDVSPGKTAGSGASDTEGDGATGSSTSQDDSGGSRTTGGADAGTTSDDSGATTTGTAGTDSVGQGSTTGEATTGSSDTSDDGGVQCQELEACCDQLGADIYTGCIAVVDMDNAGLCQQILSTYHADGYCTGETYCLELGQCCAELPPGPGWADTCSYYADLGNQPQCAVLISDYQLSDYCL